MTSFLRASTWIARAHLRRALTSRRLLVCALIAFLPTLVAFVATAASRRAVAGDLAAHLTYVLVLQIVLPLSTLLFGSAVIAEEVEDRTITYLFTRPVPRAALLAGRFASSVALLALLLCAALAALLATAARARGEGEPIDPALVPRLFTVLIFGTVAYTAVFACVGAFFRHAMMVGIGYAFAIEGFLANLPGRTQVVTIQYHMRSYLSGEGSGALQRVEEFTARTVESPARALTILAAIAVVALALGAWRVSRRQFELPS